MRFSQYKEILEILDSVIEATEYMKEKNTDELCEICVQSLSSVLNVVDNNGTAIGGLVNSINNAILNFNNRLYESGELTALLIEIKKRINDSLLEEIAILKAQIDLKPCFEIEHFYNEIMEYEEIKGEDAFEDYCKERNIDIIKELRNVLPKLDTKTNDYELLYEIAVLLEKGGDLALASVYYAKAALEMKKQNQISDYNDIVNSFNSAPKTCKEIFETVLKKYECTIVFLSICGFGKERQRYQNLAISYAQIGIKVIYITPEAYVDVVNKVSEDELAEYCVSHSNNIEGIEVITPFCASNYGVHSYNAIVSKIAGSENNAVFIISNVNAWKSLIPLKGKNKIIFDCADDNSDYKNAFWSNAQLYENEKLLVDFSDAILCTAYSLFLNKAIFQNKSNVYLSHNAVSALEMKNFTDNNEPDDLKDIPHPRIGYVGCIYQRFDRDLFYELVRNNPDKSFVIVGSIMNNYVEMLYPNMYYLGSKAHSELYKYYSNMDICIIPYFDDAKMSMSCDPVKIHEHISCGVPTITTYMPDTGIGRLMTYHANTVSGFQDCIDKILDEKPDVSREELNNYLADNSWISRACQILRIANDDIYDYEETKNCITQIKNEFDSIKDIHSNFGVIYGIASILDDHIEAEKYITRACKEYKTEFNDETLEKFKRYLAERSL